MAETFDKLISLMAYESALPTCPDDYYLRVKTKPKALTLRDIADETALKLDLNPDNVYTVLNAAGQVVTDALSSSFIVSTPTMLARPCAKGTLLRSQLTKPIDRERIRLYAAISMGPALREAISRCRVELFTQPAVTGPHLTGAEAYGIAPDGSTFSRAPQPGEVIRLTGRNIKLVGTHPSVGVTFTSVEDPARTVFVPLSRMSINRPRTLLFVLPATVTDGLWHVQVATQYSSSYHHVSLPRTSELDEPLAVGSAYTSFDADEDAADNI